MAKRPIFKPINSTPFTESIEVDFKWHAGLAKSQAQKSIDSLHQAANQHHNIKRILEISSKSRSSLGIKMSAFNLKLEHNCKTMSVESAFQGSKVFSNSGPFQDLYDRDSMSAKKDPRISRSGDLIGFKFFELLFPLKPITFFYDWLYIEALKQNKDLAKQLMNFEGFSDIAFNPKKSLNCQAKSAALYVALSRKICHPAINNSKALKAAIEGSQYKQVNQQELFK